MDKETRNDLRNMVTACRRTLESTVADELQGRFGIDRRGHVSDASTMSHLSVGGTGDRERLIAHLRHIEAGGFSPADAVGQLIREAAYTHLNRLCAYKLMARRKVIRDPVTPGEKVKEPQGFLFYLGKHPEDHALFQQGERHTAYRHFLEWLGAALSGELRALFGPDDVANLLFPPPHVLDEVLGRINDPALACIWDHEETIGWIYQYFTPKELRDKARNESAAPRNSYELAFRNQFYTPQYVVEFLTDNTLGRIWFEMRRGETYLKEQCRFLVYRKGTVFLEGGEKEPEPWHSSEDWDAIMTTNEMWTRPNPERKDIDYIFKYALTVDGYEYAQTHYERDCGELANERGGRYAESAKWEGTFEELRCCLFFEQRRYRHYGWPPEGNELTAIQTLYRAICDRWDLETEYVRFRPKRDPRDIAILDPACGSGHFLLYSFDLLQTVYEEAWDDPDLGSALQRDYGSLHELRAALPGLIIGRNLHGIDIDLRATQIASLALWLKAQTAFKELGIPRDERPAISRSNIVCAEPMPGEPGMLRDFVAGLEPQLLGELVETVWDDMKLASEAGSLLKVEESISQEISKAREQWDASEQLALFTGDKQVNERKETYSVQTISDLEFWREAEGRVVQELEAYAASVVEDAGYGRNLFVEDAVQGLAFIELCRHKFDVVLMNPPFGQTSRPSKAYVDKWYPETKNDVFAAMVERGLGWLRPRGLLGAITSRTGFFLNSFERWREELLLTQNRTLAVADLGSGVLDAMVETAAYCLEQASSDNLPTLFFRLLTASDKSLSLTQAVSAVRRRESIEDVTYVIRPADLGKLPGSPFAYWATDAVRNLFSRFPSFESDGRTSRNGMGTLDDFRFIRLWWEVAPSRLLNAAPARALANTEFQAWCRDATLGGVAWIPITRGGQYATYYADLHSVVNWARDGEEVKANVIASYGGGHWSRNIRGTDYYFLAGITWPLRGIRLSAQVVPRGAAFSVAGKLAIIENSGEILPLLALLNSKAFDCLLGLFAGKVGGVQYQSGMIGGIPVPPVETIAGLGALAESCFYAKRELDSREETSHWFRGVDFLAHTNDCIRDAVANWQVEVRATVESIHHHETQIDERSFELYGFDGADQHALESVMMWTTPKSDGSDHLSDATGDTTCSLRDGMSETRPVGRLASEASEFADAIVSYLIGCVFGRWDIRLAQDSSLASVLPDYLDPLPACAPASLVGSDGSPAQPSSIVSEDWLGARTDALEVPPKGSVQQPTIPADAYPLYVSWDGILVDDPGNALDISQRLRETLYAVRGDDAEAIERELCDLLGVSSLRDYLRRPSGFFDRHIKRYSKSRRKAPIYWLLQSSNRSYGLWLYYHRLDRDILFKALTLCVNPKIQLELNRLEGMRAEKASLHGDSGMGIRKLDKQIETQEGLLSELYDFRDKLQRAADLGLEPDLDDGVVLNIAPLHGLVPWKEAKTYWNDLLAGKYGWSSIGKQLRAKGVVAG